MCSRYSDSLLAARSGVEYGWGGDFSHPSRPALEPTQPPIQRVPGLFPGVKGPGRVVKHAPPPSAEVKETTELYVYSRLGLHGLFQGEL